MEDDLLNSSFIWEKATENMACRKPVNISYAC